MTNPDQAMVAELREPLARMLYGWTPWLREVPGDPSSAQAVPWDEGEQVMHDGYLARADQILAAFARASTVPEGFVVVPRALLAEFAEAAEDLDEKHRDDSDIWEAAAAMSISAGSLRAIAKLISAAPDAGKG